MGQIGIIARLHRIVDETVAVETAESVPCTQPQITLAVLMDFTDGIVRQAVVRRIVFIYELQRLCMESIEMTCPPQQKNYNKEYPCMFHHLHISL